jgi:hypothetical protein
VGEEPFYISSNWLEATRHLPLQATGLLMDLITHAAMGGSKALFVDRELLLSTANTQRDRAEVESWFDLLVKCSFVQPLGEGDYLIAPGLWAFGEDLDKPNRPIAI